MSVVPSHLLFSLGVLASFSVAKKVKAEEITKITKQLKKVYDEKDPDKLKQHLTDALLKNVQKQLVNSTPPGFIIPPSNPKKEALDRFYVELAVIAQALTNTFKKENMSKHQLCFIVNALINMNGVTEEDFVEFHKKFLKYKENDFTDDE